MQNIFEKWWNNTMKTIQIDNETAHRLHVFVASENAGKTHGKIGITAALGINQYIDLAENAR